MAAVDAPNVLPLATAAERYGLEYGVLRALVLTGVFTRYIFEPDRARPPMFVSVAEMEAYKRGGVDALHELRDEMKRLRAPDLGGEAGGA